MRYLYLDFECFMSKDVKLKKLTLRQYLAKAPVLGFSYAWDDAPVEWVPALFSPEMIVPFSPKMIAALAEEIVKDDVCVVAHNAAFDVRVLRHSLGLPQPAHVHCTLELCCGAFPNQPGGYSLANLARTLNTGLEKLDVDLERPDKAKLAEYCIRDTEVCRALHRMALPRLAPEEVTIAEMCNTVRELWFDVDPDRTAAAFKAFTAQAATAAVAAFKHLGAGGSKAFGIDGLEDDAEVSDDDLAKLIASGDLAVRSVKPERIKDLLLENLGFDAQSISRKKLNPERLRQNERAAKAISEVESTNKALSHMRRVRVFNNVQQVDVELGYFRATATGRFSSPQPGGRGINGHNLPKRNKIIARAIRSMFRFPEGLVAVRGDFANIEYRIEGLITGCQHVIRLFSADPMADPYLGFGNIATGRQWSKADPIRQVFKAAVLGLGYLMSHYRFTEELLRTVADPTMGLTLDDLRRTCADMGWAFAQLSKNAKAASTKLRCPEEFAVVAWFMREEFHRLHPEFGRTARWILETLGDVIRSLEPDKAVERAYQKPNAPPREWLDLRYAGDKYGRGTKNVEVYCGKWPHPTVVWRDLAMREVVQFGRLGVALTSVHATKGYRPITPSLAIENPPQSAARNALCRAVLALRQEYPYQYHVHDELMLIVPQTPDAVLNAYRRMIEVVGPGNKLGYDWAVLVNPDEITVTKSLYEVPVQTLLPKFGDDPKGKPIYPPPAEFWKRLQTDPSLLERLP